MNELRQAIRTLGRAPAFTLTAVLTIALGIAASTAVFSVVYAVLYRPLPYPDADRLVAVWQTRPANPQSNFEHEAFLADHAFISDSLLRSWQENAHCFEDIGATRGSDSAFWLAGKSSASKVSSRLLPF